MSRETTGTRVVLEKGYKICDLRPAFGVIFAKDLEGYDYWGHIDLDTFWGEMDFLLNPILDQEYDVICGAPHHVGGPFCLYKNQVLINELFKQNPNYIYAFETAENVDFDELGIKEIKYQGFEWTVRLLESAGKLRVYRDQQLYLQDFDASWWVQQTRESIISNGLVEYPTDLQPFEFGSGYWQAGKIVKLETTTPKEYVFYHFLDGKRRLFRPFPIRGCSNLKSFSVGLSGIYLNYRFGAYWFFHKLENILIAALRFLIYDLGPLRHKLRDLRHKFKRTF